MQQQSLMDLLGFDPGTIGFEGAARSALTDPTDATAGLFRSMEPFEQEMMERQTGEQAGMFGGMGGRFSRGASDADTRLRGRMGAEFARTRQQGLLQAGAQRNQALAALLGAVQGAGQVGNQRMGQMMQFAQPGAPQFQEGIAGDLLGAGGRALAAYATGGMSELAGAGASVASGGGPRGMGGSVGAQQMFPTPSIRGQAPVYNTGFGTAGGFGANSYVPTVPSNQFIYNPNLFAGGSR